MSLDIALSGDAIITRRISVCEDEGFRSAVQLFTDADVGYTHLETPIHDFQGPEIYPAAEAGGTWMYSPPFVAEELKWAGFDIVSHASNHALDYSYGGLYSTWAALEGVGIPYAGTGRNLAEARSPTYIDTAEGIVGLVSMTSSHTRWSRAGETRYDVQGRPGVNPLRYHQVVSTETMDRIKQLGTEFGWWVIPVSDTMWELTPPGIHNTVYQFIVDDDASRSTVVNKRDEQGNLRAITEASNQADIVIAHGHIHDWDGVDIGNPPDFLPPFARDCLDAGADMFVSQGSHNLRGIELYDDKPIFYDTGDLFKQVVQTKLPSDYYARYDHLLDVHEAEATPSEGQTARASATYNAAENPPRGYWSDPIVGFIIPVCTFEDGELRHVELHPGVHLDKSPAHTGLPALATDETAQDLLEYITELSAPYNTTIEIDDGVGVLH